MRHPLVSVTPMQPFRIFAMSGSLRARSSNTDILRAAAAASPAEFTVDVYTDLGSLPHFNPDDDQEDSVLPPPVTALRARIAAAAAIVISSPEYAHGVPGSLKNALDWLVSGPEMVGKPVALLNTTDRAVHAPAQLAEILRTMSARVIDLPPSVVPHQREALRAAMTHIRAQAQ